MEIFEMNENTINLILMTSALIFLVSLYRVTRGRRLNLYLTETGYTDITEGYTPVSMSVERLNLLEVIKRKAWREYLDLSLRDYSQNRFFFEIEYHFWWRFRIKVSDASAITINGKPVEEGRYYRLKNDMPVKIGDRELITHLTPQNLPTVKDVAI